MVCDGTYSAFDGVALVYFWGYERLSDIAVFLDDTLFFCSDLVIDNLEVGLVASQSEAVHYGVVGCNAILVLLGLEGGNMDCVGFAMVGGQYLLVTAAISNGGESSVICVKLGYLFVPYMYFVQADGWKGINREG